MYANAAIQFRDPFAARDSTINRQPHNYGPSTANWASYSSNQDLNRALTPPPDMTNVSHAQHLTHHNHGQRYDSHMPTHSAYRAPVAQYPSYEPSGENRVAESRDAKVSPTTQTRLPALDSAVETHSRAHKPNHNSIAPSFQIPKSVNDSGGSLSELAAEITCLFWFESSDLLQQIEDSPISLQPPRKLVKDATPTTGFRKWVTTILSTTLVAQNVVLLALLFVYRLKKLNPAVKGKPGSEYRLLTVALMLGNKFLDDNTYTNKTWAEVSGINVAEVHIMEVEFLSNMKYNLFTDVDDWSKWQSLLGKYASFVDKAAHPPAPVQARPVPILPPASSLQLPMALPSPPASNQASPPYAADLVHGGFGYNAPSSHGPTPAPSPLSLMPVSNTAYAESKKRSRDDYSTEPPAKRLASGVQDYASPRYPTQAGHNPRLTLPSLPVPQSSSQNGSVSMPISQTHHLPPLNVPARAMGMVFPSTTGPSHSQSGATAGPSSQPASQMNSQHQSRQQSPYPGSAGASPTNGLQPSAPALHPPTQVSPTYFLQQRNSPYRPVHNVSTLLYPPPSGALQHRPQSTEFQRMRYQPLGKAVQQPQTGHLPYVAQNVWLDGNQQHAMTPVHQWPGFANQ